MKVVILAGGLGTRLSEETGLRPKPMAEIGERSFGHGLLNFTFRDGLNNGKHAASFFSLCVGKRNRYNSFGPID